MDDLVDKLKVVVKDQTEAEQLMEMKKDSKRSVRCASLAEQKHLMDMPTQTQNKLQSFDQNDNCAFKTVLESSTDGMLKKLQELHKQLGHK